MFSVFLSYKYYLLELICCACTRIQSSFEITPHSLWLRVKCRLLKLAGFTQLCRSTLNLLDTWKTKKSLQNLAQSRDLLRLVIERISARCSHHQHLKMNWLTIVGGDALAANIGFGGQRWRLRIRDGPWAVGAGNSFVTGGRTLSSSPLLYKRRRKLLSSCTAITLKEQPRFIQGALWLFAQLIC